MSVSNLNGAEAYAKLQQMNEIRDEIQQYFHFDCKVWRAIEDHIQNANDCVIIERDLDDNNKQDASVESVRRHGVPQAYTKFQTKNLKEPEVFGLTIAVSYCDRDENREWERTYYVNPPIELLVNFSKARFENWLEELRQQRELRRNDKDYAQLAKLVEKFPKQTRKILKGLNSAT